MNSVFFSQGWLRLNSLVNQLQHKLTKGGLSNHTRFKQRRGCVYLIGAGTGDVELLTIKAYRLLQQADIVLYDWLANKEILASLPAETETVFVGKRTGNHSMPQEKICQQLIAHARQGKRVVRLKGGDPSIFGRLHEETRALANHGIPFAIVPGITAASGCAAYSGIQLTERDSSQSVRFITARFKDPADQPDWQNLAASRDTLVFYMGLNRILEIAGQLISHGMDPRLPMAVIDQGTTAGQQVCCSRLDSIGQQPLWCTFTGPALIIVGEVVNKRQKVNLTLLANKGASSKLNLN
ncbi:uroporphyrinogen-III C-methyltransferase [Thalassomonas viridans]|uniref:uroporphyrinogen-III C-methyltransferase n=1 Tax=Thalassomonas viridans TaxID=137584 RepID=A0AAE9Z2T3_9GAMM|nr:uroporphyrinogen-III C-methyltransferase [Thalassomonas viridans]WDE05751.1 uroporphyrinogen-III C-methyltransferase [Thalassomonas viridans]